MRLYQEYNVKGTYAVVDLSVLVICLLVQIVRFSHSSEAFFTFREESFLPIIRDSLLSGVSFSQAQLVLF